MQLAELVLNGHLLTVLIMRESGLRGLAITQAEVDEILAREPLEQPAIVAEVKDGVLEIRLMTRREGEALVEARQRGEMYG